jgi:thiol-disulfide isomerase/thioredoxin
MLQTLLPLALSLTPGLAQEGGRDPRAVALLEQAAAAAAALKTGAYTSRSQVRQGNAQAEPSQAEGQVRFAALEVEEPIGAKLAVDGRVPGGAPGGGDLVFKVAYDGTTVRGRFGAEKVVWQGPVTGDGAEILLLGDPLVMSALHEREPFARDLAAEDIQLGEDVNVDGVACRTVVVQHGESERRARHTWFLSDEDHLPRRRLAEVHRRGVFHMELLEISGLIKNPEIYPAVFNFPIPAGHEVKDFVSQRPKGPELLAVGSDAPPFELKDALGNMRTLADYRGKVLVLDFWGTWCPPCRQAMPLVQKIHERFASNDDVAVVGISTGERRGADPAGFMKKNGYTYECLLGGEAYAPVYKANGLPTFYVIGPYGKVLHASVGFDPKLDVTIGALIDETLAGRDE